MFSEIRSGLLICAIDYRFRDPFVNKMEYAPSDKDTRNKVCQKANFLFRPHLIWVQFLSVRFQSIRYRSPELTDTYLRLLEITLDEYDSMR